MTPEQLAVRFRVDLPLNPNLCDEILAPGFVLHALDPLTPPLGTGPKSMERIARLYHGTVPNMVFRVEDVFTAGDKVAVRWTSVGKHSAKVFGFRPTGKTLTNRGIDIYRIADGKIQEAWATWDTLGALTQVGAVPALGAVVGLLLGLFPRLPLWLLRRERQRFSEGDSQTAVPSEA